ncbi:MAG: MarR family winged helix-turn-helix transcriptional regulator [Motilibacteraceae bacterium]
MDQDGVTATTGTRATGRSRRQRRMRPEDYARLLAFRTTLRRFTRWSEEQAKAVGLTAAQHQLLLAVKGHDDPRGPSVGDVAEHLLLRQHSALELVDRAVAAGLLERHRDEADRRVVRLALTPHAEDDLEKLTLQHLDELRRLAPALGGLVEGLD